MDYKQIISSHPEQLLTQPYILASYPNRVILPVDTELIETLDSPVILKERIRKYDTIYRHCCVMDARSIDAELSPLRSGPIRSTGSPMQRFDEKPCSVPQLLTCLVCRKRASRVAIRAWSNDHFNLRKATEVNNR